MQQQAEYSTGSTRHACCRQALTYNPFSSAACRQSPRCPSRVCRRSPCGLETMSVAQTPSWRSVTSSPRMQCVHMRTQDKQFTERAHAQSLFVSMHSPRCIERRTLAQAMCNDGFEGAVLTISSLYGTQGLHPYRLQRIYGLACAMGSGFRFSFTISC